MAPAKEILVALIGEGVDVWRPVEAERINSEAWRIIGTNPDPEGEVWEFTHGELVRCEHRTFEGGSSGLVASEKLERPGVKQPFLTCYDYGQGGVWAWVLAESADQIRHAYPELTVLDRMPSWMTPEVLRRVESCDLDASPPVGWLAILTQHRSAKA